jgi:cell division septal protein FtsQ
MRGNLFAVNQIEVSGNRSISVKYIESASGIQIGQSIFGLRTWEIENRIKKINDVKSVRVPNVFLRLEIDLSGLKNEYTENILPLLGFCSFEAVQ